MKVNYVLLISLLIVGLLFVPAVSAIDPYDETFSELTDVTLQGGRGSYQSLTPNMQALQITVTPAEFFVGSRLVSIDADVYVQHRPEYPFINDTTLRAMQSYSWDGVPLKIGGDIVGSATIGFFKFWDDTTEKVHWYCWFDDLDLTDYTGKQVITPDFSGYEFNNVIVPRSGEATIYDLNPTSPQAHFSTGLGFLQYRHWSIIHNEWENRLISSSESIPAGDFATIDLLRVIDNKPYPSIVRIRNAAGYEFSTNYPEAGSNDIHFSALPIDQGPYLVEVQNIGTGTWFNRTLYDTAPGPTPAEDQTVTVYIKNSQTGVLIANANIAIDALVNGEYYPVTNRTEPSGIFNINLQPTGGGQPNPDGYRLIVTADGYNNPMPEINFTVDDYKQSIYCLLDPIAGGPVNENKTFIDFFVRDMSSNPISGATVKFGKYTLITNSAGYTVFEVDKNNNYTWIISKSGYGPLTGNAVIGDAPRHTINTVLAPIVTPTPQTPIPTDTEIGPTPTMTSPSGEHVSNWLEWFAAHFGMILGGGAEIGKIFMWLCFAVPVGVYVGKEAKAGAAGFMAGAGIVTLFFALIGWVPIWLVVLLALIIGLLYAKVFNTPDNGGGR